MSYMNHVYNDFKEKTDAFNAKLFLEKAKDLKDYFESVYEFINEHTNEETKEYILNGENEHKNLKLKLMKNPDWFFNGFHDSSFNQTIKGLDNFDINNYSCFIIRDNYYHYGMSIGIAWNETETIISLPEIVTASRIKFLRYTQEAVTLNSINNYNYILLLISTVLETLYDYDENAKEEQSE